MRAYLVTDWRAFFAALTATAATLTGLLFVAVSINLEHILAGGRHLTARAYETLASLVCTVVVASMVLVPQSDRALGIEVLCVVAVPFSTTVIHQCIHLRQRGDDPLLWFVSRLVTTGLGAIPALVGGASLIVRSGGGLYWLAAAVLLAIVGAVFSAWVLLVEIVR